MNSRTKKPARGASLDARAVEAIGIFVRILGRCGCDPKDIAAAVEAACRTIPRAMVEKARQALRESDNASHVLTLWFSDPAYLDRRGKPLPLPLRGPGGSLETLAARADVHLGVRELLRYFARRNALRRIGNKYVPKDRILLLRNSGGPENFRHLRGVLGMLRTQEHNGQPTRRAEGWYEVFAENPRFPITARSAFDKSMRQWGNQMMVRADGEMHRYERGRKPRERTVRMGIGIYRFEEAGDRSAHAKPRKRSRKT
jgi:hypothetical protein